MSSASTDFLLGLFAPNNLHSNLHVKRDNLHDSQPTLDEMVTKAIEILSKHPAGYLLFVENTIIDEAHHKNHARVAVDETAELAKAVEVAKELTSPAETLIVVTADHSQTLTYTGYPVWKSMIYIFNVVLTILYSYIGSSQRHLWHSRRRILGDRQNAPHDP